MYSCDYNGWADVPEEEREGLDAFEAARPPTKALVPIRYLAEAGPSGMPPKAPVIPYPAPHRKAA